MANLQQIMSFCRLQLGLSPDVQTCNLAILACSHGGDVDGILKLIDDMVAKGITPNDFTLITALQSCMFKRRGRYQVSDTS